jgi:hypothetical protein
MQEGIRDAIRGCRNPTASSWFLLYAVAVQHDGTGSHNPDARKSRIEKGITPRFSGR